MATTAGNDDGEHKVAGGGGGQSDHVVPILIAGTIFQMDITVCIF